MTGADSHSNSCYRVGFFEGYAGDKKRGLCHSPFLVTANPLQTALLHAAELAGNRSLPQAHLILQVPIAIL